jgi:hypothetical protein
VLIIIIAAIFACRYRHRGIIVLIIIIAAIFWFVRGPRTV